MLTMQGTAFAVETDQDVDEEILVEGDLKVIQARRAVENELKGLGFVPKKRKKDYLVFRHEQDWKGEIRIYDDGWVRMKRQPIQFKVPKIPALGKGAPVAVVLCLINPAACIRSRGQFVSRPKFMAQKVRTLNEIRPTVTEYNEAVLDFYTQQTLDELPPKLEELWEFGVPLASDDEVIQGVKERRQALLQFWDSRTENPWGMRVRAAVEIFIREVVQYSPNPFPSDEVRVFNESKPVRPL